MRRVLCWHGPRCVAKVAVTFDDGPQENVTPAVLDILRSKSVRSTFFLLGRELAGKGEMVRQILEEGHEIGIHGFDHSRKDIPAQVRAAKSELDRLGIESTLFRPPHGTLGVRSVLWSVLHGYTTVIWSFDARDSMRYEGKWGGESPQYGQIEAGDIVLMHDDNPVCVEELPGLIDTVREKGLEPATVSELLGFQTRGREAKQESRQDAKTAKTERR
ncbi:MAG: polysaccharide deacetylase family protein [Lentisphaerae bacterium]|nr:polysaccharide deacetylase family protein [Lentisphaerota bacterium]